MLGTTRKRSIGRRPPSAAAICPYSPKKRPSQARARATYASLLEACAQLLVRSGYAKLTTNHVAARAGVAIGSLYEYFPGKEALVAEVVRRTITEIAEEISTEFGQALRRGMGQSLEALVHAMFAAVAARSEVMRAIWRDVPFVLELSEVQRLPTLMFELARQGVPQMRSPWLSADAEAAAYLLTVLVRNAVIESVISRPPNLSQAQLERSLVAMLEAVLSAKCT